MFQVAICDDDPQHTEKVITMLKRYQADRPGVELQPHNFISGDTLMTEMDSGGAFDLFLIDIVMPGLNGIGLARRIREKNNDVPIVFLTCSKDYSFDAFRVHASQYILKPVNEDELFFVLDKIVSSFKREEERFFLFLMPERTVKIPFAAIVCVELAGRALRVYHEDGSILVSKSIRLPFEESVAPLFKDDRFFCPHKSFLINMAHVEELTSSFFIMKHGVRVPIPRYRHVAAKTRYFDWLSARGIGRVGGK